MRTRRAVPRLALVALLGAAALIVAGTAALAGRGEASPILRTVPVAGQPVAMAMDTTTGRLFVASSTDVGPATITMFDARTGNRLGAVALTTLPTAMATDGRSGHVFVLLQDDADVRMLDGRNGRMLRAMDVGCPATVPCTPSLGGPPSTLAVDARTGRAFVGMLTLGVSAVAVLDTRTGRALRLVGGPPTTTSVGGGAMAVDEATARVFALRGDGRGLDVLDARDGSPLRSIALRQDNNRRIVLDAQAGRVFIGGDTGLTILDACSGAPVGARPTVGAPIGADEKTGRVYLATPQGVTTLDARTGRTLHTARVGLLTGALAVDHGHNRVLVTTGAGIVALDARNGAALGTVELRGAALAVAVDERSGHAFVAGGEGMVQPPDPWRWLPGGLRRWLPFIARARPGDRVAPSDVSMLDLSKL